MKFIISVFMTFGFAIGAWADLTPEQAVDQYYKSKMQLETIQQLLNPSNDIQPTHRGRHCDDDEERGKSCVAEACDRLGQYGCDHKSEIEQISGYCRGLRDGSCVASSCDKLGQYGCDHHSEIKQVTDLCRSQYNGDCINVACGFLGQYGCDHISEVERIAGYCADGWVDTDCIQDSCERLGQYGCDHHSEIKDVIRLCKGE